MPAIDWAQATRIALAGVAVVAAVLVGLALVTWVTGAVLRRVGRRPGQQGSTEKAGR